MRHLMCGAVLLAIAVTCLSGQEEGEPREQPNFDGLRKMLEEKEESPAKETPSKKQAPAAHTLEQQVDKALRNGVQWLYNNQLDNGGWGDAEIGGTRHPNGQDAFGLLGLVYGGADPENPRFVKALKRCLSLTVDDLGRMTDSIAGRMLALAKLHPRLPNKMKRTVEARLKKDAAWLIEIQRDDGGWGPGDPAAILSRGYVLHFTSKAVIALSETALVVGKPPTALWRKILQGAADRCIEAQRKDGGWYTGAITGGAAEGNSWGSGTTCALATLARIRHGLYGPEARPCSGKIRGGRKRKELENAIERGFEWLKTHYSSRYEPGANTRKPDWIVWLRHLDQAAAVRRIGPNDWFPDLYPWYSNHKYLRDPDYKSEYTFPYRVAEILFTLSYARERWPTLIQKLQFDGGWNNHPLDIRNLTRYLSEQRGGERLGWHVVTLDEPLEVWQEAPILYLSAMTPITPPREMPAKQKEAFKKELHRKLREYTNSGGTIVVEASCGDKTAAGWWQNTCKDIWPEWKLKALGRKHPLWSADVTMRTKPALSGIDDGVRTLVLFSRKGFASDWNANNTTKGKSTFDLGRNLYFYSTDRSSLADWRAQRAAGLGKKYAEQTLVAGEKKTLTVARIRHGKQWNYGSNYRPWVVLSGDLQERAGLEIKVAEPVTPGQAVPEGIDFLYLTGRSTSALGEGGPQWLKEYLSKGGFLLAEATCGDKAFDASFRPLLKAAGLTLTKAAEGQSSKADWPLEADARVFTGKLFEEATGYLLKQIAFTPTLKAELKSAKPKKEQAQDALAAVLYGIYDGKRLVGLYSPYDIMFSQTGHIAFGNRGYAAGDARALASNIALLMSIR